MQRLAEKKSFYDLQIHPRRTTTALYNVDFSDAWARTQQRFYASGSRLFNCNCAHALATPSSPSLVEVLLVPHLSLFRCFSKRLSQEGVCQICLSRRFSMQAATLHFPNSFRSVLFLAPNVPMKTIAPRSSKFFCRRERRVLGRFCVFFWGSWPQSPQ